MPATEPAAPAGPPACTCARWPGTACQNNAEPGRQLCTTCDPDGSCGLLSFRDRAGTGAEITDGWHVKLGPDNYIHPEERR